MIFFFQSAGIKELPYNISQKGTIASQISSNVMFVQSRICIGKLFYSVFKIWIASYSQLT